MWFTKVTSWFIVIACIIVKNQAASTDSTNSLVVSSTGSSDNNKLGKEGHSSDVDLATLQIYQMQVKSNISNRFAHTTVVSKVKNCANKAQEAIFSVVLPENAFISGFIMEVGGKNYTAFVKEKEEAKRTYDQAVTSGLGAAHVAVSARDSNRFTVSVNVEPESKAAFYLTYEELLKREDGHYELVINIHPGQPIKDLSVEVNIAESRKIKDLKAPPIRSGNEIGTNKAELDPKATIEFVNDTSAIVRFSPNLERQKQLAHLLGTKEEAGLAGQFVVQYDVERDPQGGEVLIQDGYFVHFFAPAELIPLPKHVVFVLDTSSSMYAKKIAQLKQAMHKILEQLNENDLFHLVEFNSNIKVWDLNNASDSVWYPSNPSRSNLWLRRSEEQEQLEDINFPKACVTNADNIKKAKDTVSTFFPIGSTDIYNALKIGLHLVEITKDQNQNVDSSNHQPLIVFLTDGEPTVGISSTDRIVNEITDFNSGLRQSPIFALSFGNGADKKFLQKLALRNSGFSKHIYEASDASLQLQDFYRHISSPLLANVTFKYSSSASNLTKSEFPIHFKGSELVVAGWRDTDPISELPVVDAWNGSGLVSFKPTVQESPSSIERLWAYLTVKQLLERKEVADKDQMELKQKALDLALKYSFVTPVTSLVVVKPNATGAVDTEAAEKKQSRGGVVPSYRRSRISGGSRHAARTTSGNSFVQSSDGVRYYSRSQISGGRVHAASGDSFASPRNVLRFGGDSGNSYRRTGSSITPRISEESSSRTEYRSPARPLTFESAPVHYQPTTALPSSTTALPSTTAALSSSTTETLNLFTALPWLKSIVNQNGIISLPTGNYKLGLNKTLSDFVACPKTPLNAAGHCSLLSSCPQVHSLLTNVDMLVQHFCILHNEYAGVCCPTSL